MCSATCGTGQRHRSRGVLHTRSVDGVGCNMQLSQVSDCIQTVCPSADCLWGLWSEWSVCSTSCGGGHQNRMRHISQMPTKGGKFCTVQDKDEMRPCNTQKCTSLRCIDGLWGDWEEWSACSKTCSGGGTKVRTRHVLQTANECGKPVAGNARETKFCNTDMPCTPPVDCLFSDWGLWSACSQTCNGVMKRSRRIDRYGSGDGAFCDGALKETTPCNPTPWEGTPTACATDPPMDCTLSVWSDWSACSASCGSGARTRSRGVVVPSANGGRPCEGALNVTQQCAMALCPGPPPVDCRYGEWEDWGACTRCEGERRRFRHVTILAEHGGRACEPFDAEQVGACPRQCGEQSYCTWANWREWGQCTAQCGKGKRMRRRYLTLTDVPSVPPAPVKELMSAYTELQREADAFHAYRRQELALAFSFGLLSLVVCLLGLRAFLRSRRSTCVRPTTGIEDELGGLPLSRLPLVGVA